MMSWLETGPRFTLPGMPAGMLATRRPADEEAAIGRAEALEVRLARNAGEVARAQRLRYRVFFEEGSAIPGATARLSRRDVDAYDAVCDHLLVLDHDVPAKPFRAHRPTVVGTYRLLHRAAASRRHGFYSAREFDLAPLLTRRPDTRFLELGRSCVLKTHRGRRTMELLWAGLWAYVLAHDVDAMIGCASLDGTDPVQLAAPLAFLHHRARSPEAWRVRAHPDLFVATDRLPADALDPKAAFKALPPLIKGYLRVGATFGDGAVIDRAFGTTDVFVVMPIAEVAARYIDRLGPAANRRAA